MGTIFYKMGKHLEKHLGKLLRQIAPKCTILHFTKFFAYIANIPYLLRLLAFPLITMVELEGTEYRKGKCGRQGVVLLLLTYIYTSGETFGILSFSDSHLKWIVVDFFLIMFCNTRF